MEDYKKERWLRESYDRLNSMSAMAEEADTTQPTILRWMRKHNVSRNRNQATRGEKVEVRCPICEEQFTRYKSELKQCDTAVCSTECSDEYLSQINSGKKHPQWAGGHANYYGANWVPMRKRVRKRDGNTCRVCGKGEDQYGRVPAVHHIEPVREFDNPTEAHKMDNMVQLCQWCHAEMEKLPAKEQKDIL
jgi:5-methylcytosine-specific restriction endonuclease McrA